MKTLGKILSYILVALVAAGITCCVMMSMFIWSGDPGTDGQTGQSKLDQLESLILERYIGEADATVIEDAAAEAMISATGDQWSYYISAADYQAYTESMANSYVGVGITIQAEETGGFLIIDVTRGGPAEEAGLIVGDIIVGVDGIDAREMDTTGVSAIVKGEEGTFVDITVLRDDSEMTFNVERRTVEVPVAEYRMLADQVGLVTIANFHQGCADQTIEAIEALIDEGAEYLILDVRYNGGGYAYELVELLDYLLPEGELFRTVDYLGNEDVDYSDAEYLDMPMAVMVNGSSYSAAEFFAVALSEYEAAVVVGEQTVGKGYFQVAYKLNDGSAVSLSIGEYFTPSGRNLAGVGITPDVVVEVDEETAYGIYLGTLDPAEDPQIQAAVEALLGE